jgi:H+/Cl- antiporter ClcA
MYKQHYLRTRRRLLSTKKWKVRLVLWGSAISIGIVAALFALLSRHSDEFYHQLYTQNPFLAYSLPPLGLALIAWLTRRFFQGSEGSGIPQAIAALSMPSHVMRAKVLSLKVALAKVFLTCLGLLSGASIGREGPTVHVGASIMYTLRKYIPHMRGRDMTHALILAGGAAGISAAFNTPLAGILFAIEEMSRSFEERKSGTLVIAVVLAGVTALSILGEYTYFGHSTESIALSSAWVAVLSCGILGGLLGGIFSSSLIFGTRRIAASLSAYPIRIAFFCGLMLSLFGFLSGGQTFGTGYAEAQNLVAGGEVSALFPLYKLFATLASYLSGIPGGIFAPSLSVGAGLGADLAQLMPGIPFSAVVMLGMVGYFTGVVQTPITAFVIVMEMTDSSSMLIPLMATALIAKMVSHLVCPQPIYQALADAYLHKTVKAEKINDYYLSELKNENKK